MNVLRLVLLLLKPLLSCGLCWGISVEIPKCYVDVKSAQKGLPIYYRAYHDHVRVRCMHSKLLARERFTIVERMYSIEFTSGFTK